MFGKLGLEAKIQMAVHTFVLVVLTIATLALFHFMKTIILDSVQLRAQGIANAVIDSANMLMETGEFSEPENRKLLIKKISDSGNIIGLRLVRTEQVIKQFGPGLPEEQIKDGVERTAIESKLPSYSLEDRNGVPVFRAVTPYLVSHNFHGTDCLNCHNVEVGSVNGASDIDIDLTSDFGKLHKIILWLVVGQLVVQFILFFIMQADRRAILGLKRYAEDIIASLPAGLIVVNDALKVRSVNRSFREMFGLKNGEDVSGRELGDLLPLPDLRQQAQAVLAGGMALHGIDAALGKKWLRITITGIRLAEEEEEEEDLLVVVEDITELKAQAAHIEQLAFYDPLTGLPNRSLLRDRLQQVLTHSTRRKNHGAILFIDLDNFKALNDTKGHNIGDLLLIEVAKRLQDCIRSSDTVARMGGDEFVVVLKELDEDTLQAVAQAQDIGEKVLASLNQPFNLQGFEHYCSASIGISLFRDNEIGMDNLFRHADTAMYQAKTSGRNTLRFFDPDMQAALEARAALEADLRHALSQQQFKLFFQIQVNAANHPIGAEALLRWLHPERGLVSPLQFIPLAEDTGLILPIGLWVLETACAQIKAWETNPLACELQLAVNVSARQFHQPDFVEQVREALEKTGADPIRLKLELTESVVLDNINDAVVKMHDLKDVGVHFSMDDFGTGYSSLSYLTQLPFDQLKIDLSFVRNIGIKPTDAVIVQTIISMGNSLGMKVIAEGVESEEQRDFLERNGCHAYQGYLFSKPVPIEEFDALIRHMPN